MLRHELLPDPPLTDLVEKIENGMEWSYDQSIELETIPTIEELDESEKDIREGLKTAVTDLIAGDAMADLNTTALYNLALRQIHDTGKVITGLYAALQGRDKTRGIKEQ